LPGIQTGKPVDPVPRDHANERLASTPPLTASDAGWAIEKAREALSGVKALLAASPPERFG
jgi:hypothetical protein